MMTGALGRPSRWSLTARMCVCACCREGGRALYQRPRHAHVKRRRAGPQRAIHGKFTNKIWLHNGAATAASLLAAVVARERACLSYCNCLVEQIPEQQRRRATANCRLSS